MKFIPDFLSDPLGRKRHIEKEMKPIQFHKNPDGSVDQTPRVLFVFPVFTHVLPEAFASFVVMALHAARWCPDYKFDVMLCERELIHSAMNRAAEQCIMNPWYAGMIAFDDDCLPPANLVQRMLAHFEHGQHIVAGFGYMRKFPHTTTVGRFFKDGPIIFPNVDGKGNGEQRGFEWLDDIESFTPDEHGLITCDFCGMPAMFISRKVLVDMKAPHFLHQDTTGAVMTHDVYFCNKARDLGYSIKVDLTLECQHIGPSPLINSQTRKWAREAVEQAQKVG